MENIANILGTDALPEELVATLQEAFDKKVAEAREQAEMSVREEFAARYEHDKANLVEAMDRMLSDVVKTTEEAKSAEIAKLSEARENLSSAITEAKAHYKDKLREHLTVTKKFVNEQLLKSVKALHEAKTTTIVKQKKLDETFEALKAEVIEQQSARIKKIDEFVVKQVSRELKEFNDDHRQLVESRVKLVTEGKKKLAETQKRFVSEAAKKVEGAINQTLKREMSQLHEDLERNRQNMFGRRIFEAVAAEFMTSYLAEGTEIRKLQNVLESKDQELAATTQKLEETSKAAELSARKSRLAEDRAVRTKVMGELLSNLSGDKRSIMESMLETTKTDNLRAAFDKLLPVVLSEGKRKAQPEKKVLGESKPGERRAPTTVVTGDKATRLVESVQAEVEVEFEQEIGTILRLAGRV
jgi:hypothetical protein